MEQVDKDGFSGSKEKVVPTTCDYFLLTSYGHVMQQHVLRTPQPSTDRCHEGALVEKAAPWWRRLPPGGEQSDVSLKLQGQWLYRAQLCVTVLCFFCSIDLLP